MQTQVILLVVCLALAHGQTTMSKTAKLAPNRGVSCARSSPSSDNTCLIPGTYCGFYEECPKCVCPDGWVGVKAAGECTETCQSANLKFDDACVDTIQCANNLECNQNGACSCRLGMNPNAAQDRCVLPDAAADSCDLITGCTDKGGAGFYCHNDGTNTQCTACQVVGTPATWVDAGDSVKGNCKRCSLATGGTVGTDEVCSECFEGYRLNTDVMCEKCTDPNCARCQTSMENCDECKAGYYKDSLNKYTCTLKVKYGKPCKDQNDECETAGAECRAVEGTKQCVCIQGYSWNPSSGTCIHPDANINVQVNGTCRYDMTTLTSDALCNENDKSLQICTAGLECVADCPCVDSCTEGGKTCATPIMQGPQHIFGPPGRQNSVSGNSGDTSGAERVTSAAAVLSLALAALFW